MVTAVHGGRVWFGDREPLHVGFLPWWRVVDLDMAVKVGEVDKVEMMRRAKALAKAGEGL